MITIICIISFGNFFQFCSVFNWSVSDTKIYDFGIKHPKCFDYLEIFHVHGCSHNHHYIVIKWLPLILKYKKDHILHILDSFNWKKKNSTNFQVHKGSHTKGLYKVKIVGTQ